MIKKYFTYEHKNNSNEQKKVQMKLLIVQMRKKQFENEQITIKFRLTKPYLSNEQKNSSNEQKKILNDQKASSKEQKQFK